MEINNMVETTEERNLTIGEKLKYFFTNPNKIFEDYNTKPTWFIKLMVIIAIGIVAALLTKVVTSGAQMDILLQQTPDMTKEQAESVMQLMKSPFMTILTIVSTVIMSIIAVFLTPLIYWGLISIFGGKTTYMKLVSIYTLAYIPYFIGSLISLAFAYYTNNYESLLKPQLMDVLLKRLDLFVIWQMLLLVFGFSKVASLKLEKSAIVVAIMWLVATGISFVPVILSGLR